MNLKICSRETFSRIIGLPRKSFAATILVLLAGCAVGPNYQPPRTDAGTNWSEATLGGTTNATVQIVEWWKTFNDPTLDSLVQRAVRANYDLRLAEAQLLEARALRSGAYFDLGPVVNSSAGYTDTRLSKNVEDKLEQASQQLLPPLHSDTYDAHLDASWEIDVFGGRRRALEAAQDEFTSVEDNRRDVLISVLGDVARNYVEVRGFQQRILIARSNIKAQSEAVDIANARFNAGLTSELDVKQAEALLATTKAALPSLDTSLKQDIHALSVLLGQPPGALLAELSTDAPIPPIPPTVPVGLPSDLLRRRPDVRRAERQLASATANIGVETAELFPKFFLLGTGGFQSLGVSDWFTGASRYWSAGPTVTWRILDYGHVHSQIEVAKAQTEQSLATYQKTVLLSLEDVENALVAYGNEQVRYQALVESVAANRRALDLANELYTKGLGDFLNVLDAERSLYTAEDQEVDSNRQMTSNLVTLYKALGGGWETGLDQKIKAKK